MSPENLASIIFLISYVGIAIGSFPGLKIDRTGITLLGAIVMIASGVLSETEAFNAINLPTILLLYSLMVLSAQFTVGGFYTKVALSITKFMGEPGRFLFLLMATSAGFSALIVNDIVCLAFTPVVCTSLLRANLNPAPFLIGLACASNIGSAATIIGNPQNMLIGQVGGLHFGNYLLWCAPPAVLSLGAAFCIIMFLYRGKWRQQAHATIVSTETWSEYDAHQSEKGLIIAAILIVSFFTPVRREVAAMAVAGILLCSRRITTRSLLGLVDWHLITLFCGLFILTAGIAKYGIPLKLVSLVSAMGLDITRSADLSVLTVFLSNILSNVPAVMLLLTHVDLKEPQNLYLLGLVSTFAGNLVIIGSIANLIIVEQARRFNIQIRFYEHAKTGIPVTAASILITLLWTTLRS
jgi:Na+/H+ antiporter NhaD/arsenite permease-like protein